MVSSFSARSLPMGFKPPARSSGPSLELECGIHFNCPKLRSNHSSCANWSREIINHKLDITIDRRYRSVTSKFLSISTLLTDYGLWIYCLRDTRSGQMALKLIKLSQLRTTGRSTIKTNSGLVSTISLS